MEDPAAIVEPKIPNTSDERMTWLKDELELSYYGPNNKFRIVKDHIMVFLIPIILYFLSLNMLAYLYIIMVCEILFADTEQDGDYITFRKEN
jgi:hypothetical protein